MTAAKAAGLRCVVVPNPLTAQMAIGHADLRLGSLAEMSLAEVVAALARLGRARPPLGRGLPLSGRGVSSALRFIDNFLRGLVKPREHSF